MAAAPRRGRVGRGCGAERAGLRGGTGGVAGRNGRGCGAGGTLGTATRLATEDDASVAGGFLAVTVRPWQVMMRRDAPGRAGA